MKTLGKYYFQNRVNIHFQDLSPNLVNALTATEDVRFEEHSGVYMKRLMLVFVKTIILQQDAGGGSTITQQWATHLFPRCLSSHRARLFPPRFWRQLCRRQIFLHPDL